MICRKTLAHWFFKKSNVIYGGLPPTFDNKQTAPDLVNLFAGSLFVYRTQLTYKTKFKRILDATVLIFNNAFLGIIGNEPSGKYKDTTHHTFYHKIISVIIKAQISIKNFRRWQDEVIAGFNKRNWLAVDVSKVGQGYEKRYADSSCVIRLIDKQDQAIGIFPQTVQNVTKRINIISTTMGSM